MTIETTTVNDAPTGAAGQQEQPTVTAADAAPVTVTATPAPTFTTEQQAHIDRLIADRLKRERDKAQTAIDKAKADAEAKALADQGEYKALYEKAQADAVATAARLAQVEFDQQRRDAAQAAGIPQLWTRLQGGTPEELAADAVALAAMMQPAQPANGQPPRQPTPPTPAPQGASGLTPDERRQRAARTI